MTKFSEYVKAAARPEFFGFCAGHYALTRQELERVEDSLRHGDATALSDFEKSFARMAGGGEATAFASGRMAFYAAMMAHGVGEGDEVMLTGFTCSVMANAVWRTGARPTYADISPDTLGTCPSDVERKITPRTKLIVVQHSFGIPCEIDRIMTIARSRGILVFEDCALTIGSSLDGRLVGQWGDAAIFSTDHSKPLNTVTGGVLLTRDQKLAALAREIQQHSASLDADHQHRIMSRLKLERNWFSPSRYGVGRMLSKASGLGKRIREIAGKKEQPVFLDAEYKPRIKPGSYPYPARMPDFLARLGCLEISRWPQESESRRDLLRQFLTRAERARLHLAIPSAYGNPRFDIIPLRFAYTSDDHSRIVGRLNAKLETGWFWFKEPIVCAPGGLDGFEYAPGSCPVSESTGKRILNWPCVMHHEGRGPILEMFDMAHLG